jgi:conjugal transfer pilus assembly protein TraF
VHRILGLTLAVALLSSGAFAVRWEERKAEGWFMYEDVEEKVPEKPVEKQVESSRARVARIREDLEEKRAEAVLNPTQETVGEYIREQAKWTEQSSLFAAEWMKFVLNNPEYNSQVKAPNSQYVNGITKNLNRERKEELIRKLSADYGLFYFYKGSCQFCHAFAQVVIAFQEKYEWEVMPVSVDGEALPQFPNGEVDNGMADQMGISAVPALFLFNAEREEIVPIAFGAVSLDQVEKNLLLQFEEKDHG